MHRLSYDDTLATIAELTLADIDSFQASRKGKKNASAPLSDAELALQLYAEEAQHLLGVAKDVVFARSIDSALDSDFALVSELARAEASACHDRDVAVAISRGRPPPLAPPVSGLPALSMRLSASSSSSPIPDNLNSSRSERENILSPSSSRSVAPATPHISETAKKLTLKPETCVICTDRIHGSAIKAPCGHFYDVACLTDLFRSASKDETLFPPRCCTQPFVFADVRLHFDAELSSVLRIAFTAIGPNAPPSWALPRSRHPSSLAPSAPQQLADGAKPLHTVKTSAQILRTPMRRCSLWQSGKAGSVARDVTAL
ncbi:uncharacterized protein FIBRA_04291 [Fibroporia radiculosa]|uniref:RING-type domain-containing protein n=1 Tax=Fibroporia radiculosa TaxID=599839 RepID=J4IA33_9APHY|nr:uncharacterized protein FIBRA_04291 [Fibroporia radiculosa]CCM02211.1 predicted protein [Fibroporia radiculosa]